MANLNLKGEIEQTVKALDFGDLVRAEFEKKVVDQHYAEVRKFSSKFDEKVLEHTTVMDWYPEALRTDVIFSNNLRVVFHTRQETNMGSVRFVTDATRVDGDRVKSMKLKAFNVRAG